MLTEDEKKNPYIQQPFAIGTNWLALRHLTGLQNGRSGHRLVSIQIQFRDSNTTMILKKDSPKGAEVAFVSGVTLEDAIWVLACEIKAKTLRWRKDEWRSMRSDK
jgi:hypothetical protein